MAAPTTPLRFKSGQQPYGRRRLNRLGQSLICFSQLALHRGWVRELTETRLAIVAVLIAVLLRGNGCYGVAVGPVTESWVPGIGLDTRRLVWGRVERLLILANAGRGL
jgi:hypothetical protein